MLHLLPTMCSAVGKGWNSPRGAASQAFPEISDISVSCSVPKFLFLFYAHNDILLLSLPVCSSVACVSMFGGKFIPSKIVRNLSICSLITVAGGRDMRTLKTGRLCSLENLSNSRSQFFLFLAFSHLVWIKFKMDW